MHDYTTSSLDKFRRKFGQSISAAYIVHPGDIRQKYGILYMPIYMNSLAYWCEPCIAGGYSVSNERGRGNASFQSMAALIFCAVARKFKTEAASHTFTCLAN